MYLELIRIKQWYKNLLVFIPLIFSGKLFDTSSFFITLVGFFSLSLISSSCYIVNDIKDAEADKKHPEKRKRPIPSGLVSKGSAITIASLLFIISLVIGYLLKFEFMLFPLALFLNTLLYSFLLKNIAILEMHIIALNYILRAVSGAVLISVIISPWLLFFVFILALFLVISKRRSDLAILKKDMLKHKMVYVVYNKPFLDMLTNILAGTLLLSYVLYTFMAYETYHMMLTIPVVSFIIFRYLYFISINHEITRKTEFFFRDRQMLVAFFVWILMSVLIIYFV